MCQSAVAAAPAGHPEHAANLSKLNGALLIQARHTHDDGARASLLEQAVQAGQDAVAATLAGQPDRAMYLDNLGAALQALAEHTGRTALLDQAGRCFARAAADTGAPAAVRISGYQSMARLPGQAGLSPRQALDAMETAAALLPQAAPRNLTRADRQYSLGRLASIAGLAAAAAVRGRTTRAAEWNCWSRPAGSWPPTPWTRAAATWPGCAPKRPGWPRRSRTSAPASTPSPAPRPALTQEPAVTDRTRPRPAGTPPRPGRTSSPASGQSTASRASCRPRTWPQLAAQARPGPVIFPYATPSRCDAVILTGEPGTPVRVEPLPGLTENDAISQANRLLRARQVALGEDTGLRARRGRPPRDPRHPGLDVGRDHRTRPDQASGTPPRLQPPASPGRECGGAPSASSATCPCTPPATTTTSPPRRPAAANSPRQGRLVLHHHRPRPQLRPDPAPGPSRRLHPDRRRHHCTRHRNTRGGCGRGRQSSPPHPPRGNSAGPHPPDGPGSPARPCSRALRLPRLRQLDRPRCQHARSSPATGPHR